MDEEGIGNPYLYMIPHTTVHNQQPPPYSSSFPLPCQTMHSHLSTTQNELNALKPFLLDPYFGQDLNALLLHWQHIYEWIETQHLPYCDNSNSLFCSLCTQLNSNLIQSLLRQIDETLQAIQLKQQLLATHPSSNYYQDINTGDHNSTNETLTLETNSIPSSASLEPPPILEGSKESAKLRVFFREDSLPLIMPPTTTTSPHNEAPHTSTQTEEKMGSNKSSHSKKSIRRRKGKHWITVPGIFPFSPQIEKQQQSLPPQKPSQPTVEKQKNPSPLPPSTSKKKEPPKVTQNSHSSINSDEKELLLLTFITRANQTLESGDYEAAIEHYENANQLDTQVTPEHQLKLQQIKKAAETLKAQDTTHKEIFEASQQSIQKIMQQKPFLLENVVKAFKYALIFKRTSNDAPFYSQRLKTLLTLCENFFQSISKKSSDWESKVDLCLKASDIFLELGLFTICFDNLTLSINTHSTDPTVYLKIFEFLEQYINNHPNFPQKEAHTFLFHTLILLRTRILSTPENAQWIKTFGKLGQLAPKYGIPINA